MNKSAKVLSTIVVVVVFIILFAVLVGLRENEGHSTPGIIGTILLIGAITGILMQQETLTVCM